MWPYKEIDEIDVNDAVNIICDVFKDDFINEQSSLREDLGYGHEDMTKLVKPLNEHFGLSLTSSDLEKLDKVEDILQLLDSKLS